MLGQALGVIERARPADIMGEKIVELGLEGRIRLGGLVVLFEIEDQRHQGLGDEPAAENAEMAALVGAGAKGILTLSTHSFCFPACRSISPGTGLL